MDYYDNAWNDMIDVISTKTRCRPHCLKRKDVCRRAKRKEQLWIRHFTYGMACIYQTMGRFRETETSRRASPPLSRLMRSLVLSAYNVLGETLDGLRKYEKLRKKCAEWKAVIDKYRAKPCEATHPSLNGRYLYWQAAVAELETGHYDRAKVFAATRR